MPDTYAKLPVDERRAKWREASRRRNRRLGIRERREDGTLSPASELASDAAWKRRAACAGRPTDMFFPDRGGGMDPEAYAVCLSCPVRTECADYCLRVQMASSDTGVWGGLSSVDRRAFRGHKNPGKGGRPRWTADDIEVLIRLADRRRLTGDKRRIGQVLDEEFAAEMELMTEERLLAAKIAELLGGTP